MNVLAIWSCTYGLDILFPRHSDFINLSRYFGHLSFSAYRYLRKGMRKMTVQTLIFNELYSYLLTIKVIEN